jgi:hypothetical protein
MIFSGHSRSLHLLQSSSSESLATSQDAEARQSDRRYTSPQALPRSPTEKTTPWFAAKASEKELLKPEPSMRNEWPNGPPPSGPRSQCVAISPPTIRRSSNESEHVRRLSDHDITASFARQSFPSSVQWRRTDALSTISRRVENGSELIAAHISDSAEDSNNAAPDPESVISASTMAITDHSLDNGQLPRSALSREALWTDELDDRERTMSEFDSKTRPRSLSMYLDAAETPQFDQLFKVNSLTHLLPPQSNHQSPYLDETGSVVSDLTMSSGAAASGRSSMTSGSRRRTCHKCKKAAQAISPLFKCSKCPRRYHPHCALPKISYNSQA